VESRVGEGACFAVHLPLDAEPPSATAADAAD
jgi:hypothetical protein